MVDRSRAAAETECAIPYGWQLGLATLPFDTHTGVHAGCAEAMLQIWREADVHFIHEPRTTFASLV